MGGKRFPKTQIFPRHQTSRIKLVKKMNFSSFKKVKTNKFMHLMTREHLFWMPTLPIQNRGEKTGRAPKDGGKPFQKAGSGGKRPVELRKLHWQGGRYRSVPSQSQMLFLLVTVVMIFSGTFTQMTLPCTFLPLMLAKEYFVSKQKVLDDAF